MKARGWWALALVGVVLAPPAYSCSYGANPPDLEAQASTASSILIVKVRRLDDEVEDSPSNVFDTAARASFDVVEVLKGPRDVQRVAMTAPTSCDIWLWPGQTYVLLFDGDFLTGNLVKPMRTSFSLYDDEDAEQLKALRKQLTGPETP